MKKNETDIKPFLRWAGGKNWLARSLSLNIDTNDYNQYHEPFLGGAALFFALSPNKKSFLSDINTDLIDTYKALKQDAAAVINSLKQFENTPECYYRVRAVNYSDPATKAARFIFLNQTSFNGIYRVNLKGDYNVPYGYRKKVFYEENALLAASIALKRATLYNGDFSSNKSNIQKGDLVYLDPPYTVSHNNNGFIKYNSKLFSKDDFYRLSSYIDNIRSVGAFYILSNAAHPIVREIFDKNESIYCINRASLIGGKNAFRGAVQEYIFTNISYNILGEAIKHERI